MFYLNSYTEDALKITDEQIAADWRLGVVRGVARVVRQGALPLDSTGSWGAVVPGTNRAHVMGSNGERFCPLVEVFEVREEEGEQYNFSTFNDSTSNVITLKAKANCECGRLQKHPVQMDISPGELISRVTNAE